jgi:ribose transport system permease protein
MKRLLGILALVLALYGTVLLSNPNAASVENHQNLARRLGQWGIITLGVGVVIIAGGIDLSIGSVVGLSAASLGVLLERQVPPLPALAIVLAGAVLIGLFQGLLITKLRLQPFIVTLCGLFIFRGAAQLVTLIDYRALGLRFNTFFQSTEPILKGSSKTVGIGRNPEVAGYVHWITGKWLGVPMTFWLLLLVAAAMYVLLQRTVYGRYLYAIGYNEQAARYAGIRTDRYKLLAYILCSALAGVRGMIDLFDVGTVSPSSTGSWYELYAITGAVLGGCSLRGGEGTVLGILLGTAVLPLLNNLCIFAGVPSDLEFMVIGIALLLGTIADEVLKRRAAKRI